MPRLRMRLSIHYSRGYSCNISMARIDEIGGAPIFPCYDSLFFSPKNEQFIIMLRMLAGYPLIKVPALPGDLWQL